MELACELEKEAEELSTEVDALEKTVETILQEMPQK